MKAVRLGPADSGLCVQAARLHIRAIQHGLLPLLGDRFLTKLYLAIAAAPQSCVWAMVDGGKLVGFVAGCASVRKTYRWILANRAIGLALAAGPALFRPVVFGKLSSIVFYPFRRSKAVLTAPAPEAELLAIAVDEGEHGKGYGKRLVQAFEASLGEWGVREYWVLTNIAEAGSNAFYRATGFTPVGTVMHHALTLQAYEKLVAWELIPIAK